MSRFVGCGWQLLVLGAAVGFTASTLRAEGLDWPQFRGPDRDGKCRETGLLREWPEGGPKLLWKMTGLGRGYSTLAIVDGKFYTMGDRKGEDGEASQYVLAFDLAGRQELWATRIGKPHSDGPRCTPTIDGQLLYAIGTEGDLACLETATGKVRWRKSFPRDFGGKMMSGWKFSESPLVDGDRVVCTPGGKQATMVALDKNSGKTIWQCAVPRLNDRTPEGAAYTSMVAADIEGTRQYIQIVGQGAVGVDAKTGKCLWGYGRIANRVANIPTPLVRDNYVFVTTSYKTGSALLKIVKDGEGFKTEEVYYLSPQDFENHHGGVVLVKDCVFGGAGQNNGAPVCLDFKSGKIQWKKSPLGKRSAAVLFADGNLIFRYEDGLVALIEATPEEFRVKGTFKAAVVDGPAWPYPVIHGAKLYLRANDTLMCYDVKAK
jgi:outer membrane protein assembly factor BamB